MRLITSWGRRAAMMKMGPEGLRRSRDESQDFQVQYACMHGEVRYGTVRYGMVHT